jgi:hypothetical protein
VRAIRGAYLLGILSFHGLPADVPPWHEHEPCGCAGPLSDWLTVHYVKRVLEWLTCAGFKRDEQVSVK